MRIKILIIYLFINLPVYSVNYSNSFLDGKDYNDKQTDHLDHQSDNDGQSDNKENIQNIQTTSLGNISKEEGGKPAADKIIDKELSISSDDPNHMNLQDNIQENDADQAEKDRRLWRDIKLILMTPYGMSYLRTPQIVDYLVRHLHCPKRQILMACALYQIHHGLPSHIKSPYLKEKIDVFYETGLKFSKNNNLQDAEAALIRGWYYIGFLKASKYYPRVPSLSKEQYQLHSDDIFCKAGLIFGKIAHETEFYNFIQEHFANDIQEGDLMASCLQENVYKILLSKLDKKFYSRNNFENYFELVRQIKEIF